MHRRCLTFIMYCIIRTNVFLLGSLLFISLFLNTNVALADSCPCCGQTYGNPMPGDESRVYQLRRAHEASCCRKASTPIYQKQPVIDYEAERQRQEAERQRKLQTERQRKQELEEQRKREEQEEKKRQAEFERKKQDTLKSMKGTAKGEPGLKGSDAGSLGLKGIGDKGNTDLGLKGTEYKESVKDKQANEKRQKGWQKALGCAMEEVYARAESLGTAGVRFSKDLRKEMKRVYKEAGKPVKDRNDVNIVNLTLDRQVSADSDSAERQFIVEVAVHSKGNGNIVVDVQSYFSKSTDKKDRQANLQSILVLNEYGKVVMSENSAAVKACLAR